MHHRRIRDDPVTISSSAAAEPKGTDHRQQTSEPMMIGPTSLAFALFIIIIVFCTPRPEPEAEWRHINAEPESESAVVCYVTFIVNTPFLTPTIAQQQQQLVSRDFFMVPSFLDHTTTGSRLLALLFLIIASSRWSLARIIDIYR